MTLQEIKSKLPISTVLGHYGLQANGNKMVNCPFHEDKTPSMQVYPETNTVFCFSGNCTKSGKAIDQIDFILHQEGCSKHEAINKAKALVNAPPAATPRRATPTHTPTQNLDAVFTQLKMNLPKSRKATEYLRSRGLYDMQLEIGSNHKTSINGKNEYAYPGLKNCIIFPLKDKRGQVVSLYGRAVSGQGHYYSSNRQGLYPGYPPRDTSTILLTESILDAATVNKYTDYTALALYGTHGLSSAHKEALCCLKQLQEIVLFLDGDPAGQQATQKYSQALHTLLPPVAISQVPTPEGEDPNSLVQSHEPTILTHLIAERKPLFPAPDPPSSPADNALFFSSNEKRSPSSSSNARNTSLEAEKNRASTSGAGKTAPPRLDTSHPEYLSWRQDKLMIVILGRVSLHPLDKLKVTLKIARTDSRSPLHSLRHSLDLYHDDQSEKLIRKAAERLELGSRQMQLTISELTQALESYREAQLALQKPKPPEKRVLTAERERQAIGFLRRPDVMAATDALIEQSGVVGEQINRQLLWYVYTTRLREQPLHVICLGASGTGKTWLQERVAELIPAQDKVSGTSISENALYYAQDLKLSHKLFLIEDLDGASHVLYSLRELQTKASISKIVTHKDSKGNLKTIVLEVHGPICLSGTTTQERLYEDNANRCLLLYLDSSPAQQAAIMAYQRKRSAGKINKKQVQAAIEFLRDVQSVLKPIAVRNPYAEALHLPPTVFKPLRTNAHYLAFIEAITFYHQYQRAVKSDPETGEVYIETTLADIAAANELLKDVLLAKSDELSKACRDFFETLKGQLQKLGKSSFYRSMVREWMRINPNNLRYYLKQLVQYGYLNLLGSHKHLGYEYEVRELDEYQKLNGTLQNALDSALNALRSQRQQAG